jgi:hypothetical protein
VLDRTRTPYSTYAAGTPLGTSPADGRPGGRTGP